ncbi:MAG: glycosyltransferase [Candidatus Omnitrophota bacterium]
MKILHITTVIHPYLNNFIREESLKEVVNVLVITKDGRPGKDFIKKNLVVTYIRGDTSNFVCSKDESLCRDVLAHINHEKPDVVNFQYCIGIDILSIMEELVHRGIKMVTFLHDHFLYCPRVTNLNNKENICTGAFHSCSSCCIYDYFSKKTGLTPDYWVSRKKMTAIKIMSLFDAVICPSHSLKNKLDGLFPWFKDKTVVRYSGVKKYGCKRRIIRGIKTIGYCGSVTYQKGIDYFLEAFDRACRQRDINLLLAIRRPEPKTFNKVYKIIRRNPRIQFMWDVPYEKIYSKFYRRIDLLVIPSIFQEPGPLVLWEAFVHGIPVLVPEIDSIVEKVKVGVNALVFKYKSSPDLEKQIKYAVDKFPFCFDDSSNWYTPMKQHVSEIRKLYRTTNIC